MTISIESASVHLISFWAKFFDIFFSPRKLKKKFFLFFDLRRFLFDFWEEKVKSSSVRSIVAIGNWCNHLAWFVCANKTFEEFQIQSNNFLNNCRLSISDIFFILMLFIRKVSFLLVLGCVKETKMKVYEILPLMKV